MSESIRDTLEEKFERFGELERQMADAVIQGDGARMSAIAREQVGWSSWSTVMRDSRG